MFYKIILFDGDTLPCEVDSVIILILPERKLILGVLAFPCFIT